MGALFLVYPNLYGERPTIKPNSEALESAMGTENSPARAPPPKRAPPSHGFPNVFGHISAKNSPIFIP